MPVVEAIRERNILKEFPGQTETDMYLWVSEHRAELQQGLGDFISPESAAQELADKFGTRAGRVAARFGKSLVRVAVPGDPTELSRALVAYDGGAKSTEALFVAAYLAARWNIPLTVLSVEESGVDAEDMLEEADEYLHTRSVRASHVLRGGPVSDAILRAAGEAGSQLLILGGYGNHPVLEAVLGSPGNTVLRQSRFPMLICR